MALQENLDNSFRKKASAMFDWTTVALILFLLTAGLMSIYSATYDAGTSRFFYKQLTFSGIGLGVMIVTMFIPSRFFKLYNIPLFIISLLLLVGVLFFGKVVSGTKGWYQFGALSFQPAELAKIGMLLVSAGFLSKKGRDIKTLRDLMLASLLVAAPVVLVLMQPDVGSASVMIFAFLGILLWTGFDLFVLTTMAFVPVILVLSLIDPVYFYVGIIIYIITAIFFRRNIPLTIIAIAIVFAVGHFAGSMMELLPDNSRTRIETFIHPEKDPLGKGYNVMQSVLAVGSGGITGKGFLQGTQTQLRYIPEQRTDFIFCVPTEEFGFVGGVLVILLMSGFILRAVRIASNTDDKFMGIIAIGIASIFLYHTIVNIGMVIRLMPVMGIPLPFMSYGGTALVINLGMVGLLLNIYRNQKKSGKIN